MATQGSLQNASQAAKEQASGVLRDATSGVGEFAGALRNAAKQIDGGQHPTTARLATEAADALERMSSSLRSKDLDAMLGETERFARSQPALFLGAAVAAGFLAVRFLKSSSPDNQGELNAPDFRP
ncbi:MAG TPA: hypothetical protein VFC18_22345 [Burkholderiales bacterium]|nr:hypothetical protein [Burkholderiales bacterium]